MVRRGDGVFIDSLRAASHWWWTVHHKLVINTAYVWAGRAGSCWLYVVERREKQMATARKGREQILSFAEKLLLNQKQQEGRPTEATDEEFEKAYPQLCDLLTRKLKDDKRKIEPASLIFFCRGGSWKVMISHKGLKVRWNSEGNTFLEALASLEKAVSKEEGQETPGSDPQP